MTFPQRTLEFCLVGRKTGTVNGHLRNLMGRPVGGRTGCIEERGIGNDLVTKRGVDESWVGGETVDWIGGDVGFEFDAADG